ncbi:hypothetical protein AB0H83_35815 [Dactylosporangium sp. NPDC050688]|uniref:hypothetical protein n=1 Tax=Dactylosporangium sp. NPDC050688 TaxID=3157217 RepID=UPI0033F50B65
MVERVPGQVAQGLAAGDDLVLAEQQVLERIRVLRRRITLGVRPAHIRAGYVA